MTMYVSEKDPSQERETNPIRTEEADPKKTESLQEIRMDARTTSLRLVASQKRPVGFSRRDFQVPEFQGTEASGDEEEQAASSFATAASKSQSFKIARPTSMTTALTVVHCAVKWKQKTASHRDVRRERRVNDSRKDLMAAYEERLIASKVKARSEFYQKASQEIGVKAEPKQQGRKLGDSKEGPGATIAGLKLDPKPQMRKLGDKAQAPGSTGTTTRRLQAPGSTETVMRRLDLAKKEKISSNRLGAKESAWNATQAGAGPVRQSSFKGAKSKTDSEEKRSVSFSSEKAMYKKTCLDLTEGPPEHVILPQQKVSPQRRELVRWDSSLKSFTVKIQLGDSQVMSTSAVPLPVVSPGDLPTKDVVVQKLVAETEKKLKKVYSDVSSAGSVYLTWEDSDGDQRIVDTDSVLADAILHARTTGTACVRLGSQFAKPAMTTAASGAGGTAQSLQPQAIASSSNGQSPRDYQAKKSSSWCCLWGGAGRGAEQHRGHPMVLPEA
jgi:hypothetical protein